MGLGSMLSAETWPVTYKMSSYFVVSNVHASTTGARPSAGTSITKLISFHVRDQQWKF